MKLMQNLLNEMKSKNLNNLNGNQIVSWIESNEKNLGVRDKTQIPSIILHLADLFNEAEVLGNINGINLEIIIQQVKINKTKSYSILKNNLNVRELKDPFSSDIKEPEKRCLFLLKKIKQSHAKMFFKLNSVKVVIEMGAAAKR